MIAKYRVFNNVTNSYELHAPLNAGSVVEQIKPGSPAPDSWITVDDRATLEKKTNIDKGVTFLYRGSGGRQYLIDMGFYDLVDVGTFPTDGTHIYTMPNGNYMVASINAYGVIQLGWRDINDEVLSGWDLQTFSPGGYSISTFFPIITPECSSALDMAYGYVHSYARLQIIHNNNNHWDLWQGPTGNWSGPPYTYYVPKMNIMDTTIWTLCNKFWYGVKPYSLDPYDDVPGTIGPGGGGAGTGGGDPTAWTDTDDIDFPGDPGISAVNTGFISLWSPTEQQMLNLSRYMWNVDITTIDFWKRLWADPMDIIYGLNIIPVDLRAPGRSIIGGTESVTMGLVNTKVQMDYLTSQWIEVDCGSLNVDEIWGAYIDYDPYTKLEIYLPYCGVHPLRVDDFMSGSISVKYKIDLLSGACLALIKATKPNVENVDLDSVVYQFMGNCATQIPVTASQFADAVRSTMSLAASIGSMVATGVGGAAAAASKHGLSAVGKANLVSGMIGEGAAAAENVMGIKPGIERSGAIGGAAGLLAIQTPYLIITRPRQAHPEDQSTYTGYPAFTTRSLWDVTGWTIVKAIHLDNIKCTADEMVEIDSLLKEGVIF